MLSPFTFFSYFASACSGGSGSALDLVFLIDGSKSVRPENFELVKKFINQIVDSLEVSEKQAQVGLVQYSSSVRQEFPLGQFKNKKDIKAAVKKMAYMEKGTMTGQALKYLIDNSFAVINGARPGVPKVGIVFTDGRSQDYITDAAKKAKDLGRSSEFSVACFSLGPRTTSTVNLGMTLLPEMSLTQDRNSFS